MRPTHTKYGYETAEWARADARLEKWLKRKKARDTSRRNTNAGKTAIYVPSVPSK